jgi:capsular exopolysaccharide synthesis family protein
MTTAQRSNQAATGTENFEGDLDVGMARPAGQNLLKQVVLGFVGRWYWIVLGLILGFLWANYQLGKTPKQYSATATLLIKEQTASVMARDQVDEMNLRSQEAMNTVVARIRRTSLLERVASRQDVRELPGVIPPAVDWRPEWLIRKLGKASVDPARQAAPAPSANGGMIAGWLGVSIRHGTRLLDISITHPVPEVAKALADAVAREYLAEIATSSTKGRSKVIDLLDYESKEARASLRDASSTLAIYARALEVHKALDAKETETVALQRRYLPKHPRMVAANAELTQVQESFIREATSDKSYWEGAELPEAQTNPAEYLRSARQQLLAHIGVLQSEIGSSTSVFNSMLTRIQETSVNQESEESSAEVSELASVPGWPSSPNPSKVRSSGTMGGLIGGLMLAVLFIRLDNKYQTVSQIANVTGVPILGAIPEIKLHHLAVAEKSFGKRHPDEAVDPRAAWEKRVVFRNGTASTSYAEMYRSLRASVSRLGDESKRKITLFSSALPGEGKTLTSANFAAGAAGQGRKTLLIDLDLRKPAVHKVFGLTCEREQGGITECLANLAPYDEVICHESGHEHLDLILGGKHAPNPGELLNTGRLRELLAQACRDYEVVVLDTAPFLAVPDTRIIAPLAHNFCLVAKADYVPKGAIRRALEVLEGDGIPLSGIIFNGYKERRYLMGENYSYGYYKPSRYGRAYRYSYDSYGSYGYSGV